MGQSVGTSIDQVLHDAVESGAVPNVAAIAADRDGVIYEGAAGPRLPGGGLRSGERRHALPGHVDDEDGRDGGGAAAGGAGQAGPRRADRALPPGVRRAAGPRGLRRRHSAAAPAGERGHRQAAHHAHGRAELLVLEPGHRQVEAATGTPNVLSGLNACFTAPLVADPGTTYEYGINTDWLGKVVEAAGGKTLDVAIAEGITGPLGMADRVPHVPRQRATRCGPLSGRRLVGRPSRTSTAQLTRSTSPAATACTRRRATT